MFELNRPKARQTGTVLVIALVLLFVLTVLGVASMSGTIMQERMAGNVNLQTLAFNAASAGVATSINFANPATWIDSTGDPRACLRGGAASEWTSGWTAFQSFTAPNAPQGTTVAYRQMVGCFEAENALDHWNNPDDVPLQLLVLNQGAVCTGSSCQANGDNFLAMREVEVRVEGRGGSLEPVFGLCGFDEDKVPCTGGGQNCPIQMPSSQQGDDDGGRVDARGFGVPISVEGDGVQEMLDQLGRRRIGFYQPQPAVREVPSDAFWGDDEAMALMMNAIKIGVTGFQSSPILRRVDANGTITILDDLPFSSCRGSVIAGDSTTCPQNGWDYITYVAGDLTLNSSGNPSCRVQGSVFIEQQLRLNGQVTFESDFVVKGGRLEINGLGANVSNGTIRVCELNVRDPSLSARPAYDPANATLGNTEWFNISGMGGSQVRVGQAECSSIQQRRNQLNLCLNQVRAVRASLAQAGVELSNSALQGDFDRLDSTAFDTLQFPVPSCGSAAVGRRDVIASWREYLDRARWP